ncbi:MAG: hypothetical protein ACLUDU_02815 [Butyricimonas faecihominis]
MNTKTYHTFSVQNNAIKASIYTGIAYIITVVVLITPSVLDACLEQVTTQDNKAAR